MKKLYVSVLVTGLLIQPVWADDTDGGAVPAVEVEAPQVEVVTEESVGLGLPESTEGNERKEAEVQTFGVEVTDGETQTLEAPVNGELDPAICDKGPVDVSGEFVDPAVCFPAEGGLVDENGELIEPVVCDFGGVGNIPVDENGVVIDPAVDFPVDGEVPLGEVVEGEVFCTVGDGEVPGRELILSNTIGEMPTEEVAPAGGSEEPVQNLSDDEASDLASQSGVSRSGDEEIQPYFRTLTAGGGAESANSVANTSVADVNSEIEQVANEQRTPVRLFEKAEETTAPIKRGLSRLFGKKTATKAATSADKTLAQKLAEVDQLRDKALATRNSKLLAHADKLEAQIRQGQKGTKTMAPKKK